MDHAANPRYSKLYMNLTKKIQRAKERWKFQVQNQPHSTDLALLMRHGQVCHGLWKTVEKLEFLRAVELENTKNKEFTSLRASRSKPGE